MSHPRKDVVIDVDDVQIPAILRKPLQGRQHYHVRWKLHGVWRSATTGRDLLQEAEVVARQIVRGEKPEVPPSLSTEVTVNQNPPDCLMVHREGDK